MTLPLFHPPFHLRPQPRPRGGGRSVRGFALATAGLLVSALTACSVVGQDEEPRPSDESGDAQARGPVVLVTHESFALPKRLMKQFTAETGYRIEQRSVGDAGALTNRLALTTDSPVGDVAFGVDNTFASRALGEDVFAAAETDLPAGAEEYVLPGDEGERLVPVDNADVCVNVDTAWFEREEIDPPETLSDLTKPRYEDLMVAPGAPTSSPGLAFLLATEAEFGADWPAYWQSLVDNGLKIVPGWSDAYQVDFTQGGGKGDRPIVVSYDSSPAFTVSGGETTTAALLETCVRQVEYAGVLAGAENPEGARAVLTWLLSADVQAALPESMFVYPVRDDVDLPQEWATYAEQPEDPYAVDPEEVAEKRARWLRTWTDVTTG